MKKIIFEIIRSYENRIIEISKIIEGSNDLISRYREQRLEILNDLKDNLAHAVSLRKKDFEEIMAEIRMLHKKREKEVKKILDQCINNHRNMAEELRSLLEEKVSESEEQAHISRFRLIFKKIRKKQEKREKEVKEILERFKREQLDFMDVMHSLLEKGENIQIPEVKSAVKNLSLNGQYSNDNNKEDYYVSG
ncbi:MAG: hypothetical protein K9N00_03985 [Candidatus Marinimicrobia bacterium]|nr:hypothetical protein [Candidatus Neomarinimicrobiota bacterium]